MLRSIMIIAAVAVAGCAEVSTMQLAQDTLQITSRADPACGVTGAQRVAMTRAAKETIARGYDRFQIVATERQAQATGASWWGYGNSTIHQSQSQGLTVKMFKDDDPAGAMALSARETLGPNWQQRLRSDDTSCT
jgi:hypothetical protein